MPTTTIKKVKAKEITSIYFEEEEAASVKTFLIKYENFIATYIPTIREIKEANATKSPFLIPLYKAKSNNAPKIISKKLIVLFLI